MSPSATSVNTNGHTTNTNGLTNGHGAGALNGSGFVNGSGSVANGHGPAKPTTNGDGSAPKPLAEPIAICGIGLRLPGAINTTEDFWDMLVNKRSGRCKVPKTRYDVDSWYGPGKIGHVGTKFGYFLDNIDLENMDQSFWSFTKAECEAMDPQQRLLLEVVYEALQSAGQKSTDLWGKSVGVFVGTFEGDWLELDGRDVEYLHRHRQMGSGDFMAANRIHYEYGFTGPSAVIRTACSSSMLALHDACTAINTGQCEAAIVGGTSIIFSPTTTASMAELGMTSPSGYCHSFDAAADGYARGEAVSAVYVKKLSDALRDGDPVRSVIRSTCLNAGGRSSTLTAPVTAAHEANIRRGLELAGIRDFSKPAMIECHGTGTPVGDPIEVQAVANVFGEHGIYIGSVKTNLGHSEAASGLSSIVKMTLALENETIPPNLNFKTPNPHIPWESAKLKVATEPTKWPKDRDFVVGINSFGVGGSNAHVVLGSAASFGADRTRDSRPAADVSAPTLLVFSAKHPEALRKMIEKHQAYHLTHPDRLRDMSYSLAMKRDAFVSHRAFCVTDGLDDWAVKSAARAASAPRQAAKVVMVFSGQGAQWPRMGKELYESYPVFRHSLEAMDEFLHTLEDGPTWSLVAEMLKAKKISRLSSAELAQPCTTALQIALVNLLRQSGVEPDMVVGHSSGEVAAAYASGVLTAKEAILVAYYRGKTMSLVDESIGGMAAVGLGAKACLPHLPEGVLVGCENSPDSTTLTGDKEALQKALAQIKEAYPDAFVRELRVDRAYHSHHMRRVAPQYLALMKSHIQPKGALVPFHSSVKGHIINAAEDFGPQYWVDNLVSPVRFSTAVSDIMSATADPKTFVEVGPHATLSGPIRQILKADQKSADYVNTMTRGEDCASGMLKALGELWLLQHRVDFSAVSGRGQFLTDLPLYPWHYEEPLWSESRISRDYRLRKFPHHELLGARVLESTDQSPCWRNLLRLESVPWIKDHEVFGDALVPGVGFVTMAGEAIRQLTGASDFTVQHVHIKAAMALDHDSALEVVTQLDRAPLTNALDSAWYSFSISSLRSGTWVKHAFGQVCAGSEFPPGPLPDVRPLPRTVSEKAWYRKFRGAGLDYGPRFQGLRNITAHPTKPELVATITNDVRPAESYYAVHPGALDCLAQALVPALCSGLTRRLGSIAVPTYIEEFYCRPSATEDLAIHVIATEQKRNAYTGDVTAVSDGQVAVRAKGFRLTFVDSGSNNDARTEKYSHGAAELEWKQDINLADMSGLFHNEMPPVEVCTALQRFFALCTIEVAQRVRNIKPALDHLALFAAWATKVAAGTQLNGLLEGAEVLREDGARRDAVMETLYSKLKDSEAHAPATALRRIVHNTEAIMRGTIEGLDILMDDNVLHEIYNYMQITDISPFLGLLTHKKPNLRVLEIGAGTGGTTAMVLPALQSAYGERMYLTYTYTDISPGFLLPAQERFHDHEGIEYRVLDISQDPAEQGFENDLESYDLVISTNCLHATPRIQETLRNVRKLMHPHGRLLLQELSPPPDGKWVNLVMGVLPGWWLGLEDDRPEEPYMDAKRWDKELTGAGFQGAQTVFFDGQASNNIITTPAPPISAEEQEKRVTLLVPSHTSETSEPHVRAVTDQVRGAGYGVDVRHLAQAADLTPDQDVIALLDLEKPFFHDLDEAGLRSFQDLVAHAKERRCGVLWVTGQSQAGTKDPRYAQVVGVARVLRLELGLDFATLEMGFGPEFDAQAVTRVLGEFQRRDRDTEESDTTCEAEWVHVAGAGAGAGQVLIGRWHYLDMNSELKAPQTQNSNQKTYLKLDDSRPGLVEALAWKRLAEEDLGPEEVRVQVRAVGLNAKDVSIASGVDVEPRSIVHGMGYECSGIITAVGTNVTKHRVGDSVAVFSSGLFATSTAVSQDSCVKMPDGMSFEEGATMPVAFMTAIYCLLHAGRLTKGMSVLIHAASGGVGLAAIQLSQMVGADIYCTVGSEDKAQHLVSHFGIPREHIFSSRDTSFLPALIAKTNGRGADVVLNSLSGEPLHASWKCVAEYGTFVEIGRRDVIGQANLSMQPFESNRSFVGFNLSYMGTQRPEIIARLFSQMMDFVREGHIKPLLPMQTFGAAQLSEPIRLMQKAQHIGKMVITMPTSANEELELPSEGLHDPFRARSDAAYLFTGGLGGLGKSTATWLAGRGARHLVFISRSAGTAEHEAFLRELECLGCTSVTVQGDVANYDDVVRAVKAAGMPICGVFHAPLILKDAAFLDMSFDQWSAVNRPKVDGAMNLHKALLGEKLDFFFLYSSIVTLSGQLGQANYCAANTFVEAFVSYRHSLGLPASTLMVGAVGDVGWVADNPDALEKLRATAQYISNEVEYLDCVELMLKRPGPYPQDLAGQGRLVQHSQIAFGARATVPMTAPTNRATFRKDPRLLVYRNLEAAFFAGGSSTLAQAGSEDPAQEELSRFLAAAAVSMALLRSAEATSLLARQLGRTLCGFMLKPDDDFDVHAPLADVGMDSLVSIELRNWIRKKIGVEVNVLEITRASSLEDLGGMVQNKIVEKYEARR